MNRKQLQKIGVPPDCVVLAVRALTAEAEQGTGFGLKGKRAKELVAKVLGEPGSYVDDELWGALARELIADVELPKHEPIAYQTYACKTPGDEIDPGAHAQMRQACAVPTAVGAALMPDAHIGYGLPIGGVLACDNAVRDYSRGHLKF